MRILLLAALLPLAACGPIGGGDDSPGIVGTGSGGTRSYAADGFTQVELAGPDDVDVRVGPAFSVRAEGDSAVLGQLRITRDGDTLRVGRRRSIGWSGHGSAKIHVTMPRITEASLAGSGDLTLDRAEAETFKASLAGSGDLALGQLATGDTRFDIAGSGGISARGMARALKVSIAGSGDVDAGGLVANGAEITVMGSGNVTAAVDGAAKVTVMGSGDVDLGARARCTTSKMGSGSVRCGG